MNYRKDGSAYHAHMFVIKDRATHSFLIELPADMEIIEDKIEGKKHTIRVGTRNEKIALEKARKSTMDVEEETTLGLMGGCAPSPGHYDSDR